MLAYPAQPRFSQPWIFNWANVRLTVTATATVNEWLSEWLPDGKRKHGACEALRLQVNTLFWPDTLKAKKIFFSFLYAWFRFLFFAFHGMPKQQNGYKLICLINQKPKRNHFQYEKTMGREAETLKGGKSLLSAAAFSFSARFPCVWMFPIGPNNN